MAEDVDPNAGSTGGDGDGAGEGEGGPPAAPSVLDRVAMSEEDRAALPDGDRNISLEDVSTAVEAARSQTKLDTEVALRTQIAQQEQLQRQEQRAKQAVSAGDQADIEYFQRLQKDKRSDDATVKATAEAELLIPENDDMYVRGGAAVRTATLQQQAAESMARLYNVMSAEVSGTDYATALPPAGDPAWLAMQTRLADFDGKGGLCAFLVESGRALGLEEGLAKGREGAERDGRIENGRNGAPQFGDGTARKRTIDDIDTSKPGAGRELFRLGVELGSKR